MERAKSRADVAVFVDFENVYVSVREKFDAQPNFELIMDRCEDYGRIVIARAYADWYRYPRVTSALFANGVEPMYVPTYHYDREVGRTGRPIKNSVDIHLCIDAMRTLYTQTHIDKFVLVTGDRDFIPLVNAIRQHGKDVIIIGIGGAASAHLAQSGDEFLFYEQIADLKTPQQQRQEQRQEGTRPERRERAERGERERGDGNGRVESAARAESNGKADGKRERQAPERPTPPPAPEPVEAAPVPAPERTFFDTLVDAINLARQRGFVSNLGSLKVLMRELDSGFHESKAKDGGGRPFTKFKDFVKEAERQGKVQIFTNGTVTEVFLPGEDPLSVSQFAEDLASQQVERELESELAQQEALQAPPAETPEVAAPTDEDLVDAVEQPTLPGLPEEVGEPETVQAAAVAAPSDATIAEAAEPTPNEQSRPTFAEREWQIFRASMSQFVDPVRFAEIFGALRGLRNQEVFDLTNNELKELVKQAINRGMLQRTGRGARAYYRLSTQYRIAQDADQLDQRDDAAAAGLASAAAPQMLGQSPADSADNTTVEAAAGQVNDAGLAPAARRRRGRSYDVIVPDAAGEGTDASPTPTGPNDVQPELQATVADQMAVQLVDEPAPIKPRRNRRKKVGAAAEPEQAAATAAEAPAAEAPQPASGEADQQQGGNGSKKRRTRRKKTAAAEDGAGNAEAGGE